MGHGGVATRQQRNYKNETYLHIFHIYTFYRHMPLCELRAGVQSASAYVCVWVSVCLTVRVMKVRRAVDAKN